jgi:type VI secretion system protein ImpL
MDKIKKIVTSAWFIPTISLILIFLVIWFAGPYFAFADYYPLEALSNRIILIITILLVYFLIQLIKYHRRVKNQQDMVADITEDNSVNEAINAESAELKDKFNQAFSLLKNNKAGPSSLTELPWYMIIGSPGSGKTTLLSNSGLKFPLFNEFSNQAIQGVGGTKNCDWWITQDAVLLDTAGRYTSQDSHQEADKSGWTNFLGLIKKYRKKPVSGLLVSFSMSDLMTLSEYDLNQQIMQMKQRIAEVNDFFSTKFPIYIIITKSDMVAGFSQFYETFSHKEREQTFGITLDRNESLSGDLLPSFTQKFNALMQSITRRQWQRISLERDASRKSLIYSFSDQFSELQPALANVIENLSKQDDGLTTGIVRGLYFTSGTQYGAPIDRMIAKVSQNFGLKSTAKALWNNDQRSYFIKELLKDVVFPESDQFGVLTGYENRKSTIKKVSMAVAGVFTLAVSIGLFISYSNNDHYISLSEKSVDSWSEQYENPNNSGDIRSYIPALNDFSNNISALIELDNAQFSGLGLAQSDALQGALTASYGRLLNTVLLPYVKSEVELQLSNTQEASEHYQALKAYLMLSSTDKRDDDFLIFWLQRNLNNNEYFSAAEFVQLSAHIENLIQNKMVFESINEQLVAKARQDLRSQPIADIYYKQFRLNYLNDSDMLSMAQLAGTDWRTVMSTEKDGILTIAKLYTPELFTQITSKDIKNYLKKIDNESWILGEGNIINKGALAVQLEKIYALDYVNNWQSLLNSISMNKIDNMDALNSALMLLSRVDSPLFLLLDSASQATKLVENVATSSLANLSARGGAVLDKSKKINALRNNDTSEYFITSQFIKLHELMSDERKTVVQQKMSAVISEISVALSFGMKNEEAKIDEGTFSSLDAFGYVQIEPFNLWISQLSSNIKNMRNQLLKNKIAKIWQQDVLAQCNDIISFKYPFEKSSKTDASLVDLQTLFGTSGAIHQFFVEHLQPLIKSKAYPWQWKDNVAETHGFSPEVLPFFEQQSRVRDSLFVIDGNRAQLDFSLKPIFLDSRLAKFKMSIHGQNMSYQFGRPITTNVSWPPENFSANSQFNFIRRDGSEVVEIRNGLFAFFRLLDASDINQVNRNKVEVTFSKNNFKAIYELSGKGKVNPVIFSQLANFKCLAAL